MVRKLLLKCWFWNIERICLGCLWVRLVRCWVLVRVMVNGLFIIMCLLVCKVCLVRLVWVVLGEVMIIRLMLVVSMVLFGLVLIWVLGRLVCICLGLWEIMCFRYNVGIVWISGVWKVLLVKL